MEKVVFRWKVPRSRYGAGGESYHPACRPAVAGQLVELQVQVPRLRCNHASCPQVIFAERLPAVMLPRARRTVRPREALTSLGL